MTRIGLTGGVGSGKSTVASMLLDRGAFVVDADAVAREVVAVGTEGLSALVAEFGEGILATDGSLNRVALAERAFADDAARARLNEITHPRIAARTAELMSRANPGQVVVHDVPLLVELGLMPAYDLVVGVGAGVLPEGRVQRHAGGRSPPSDGGAVQPRRPARSRRCGARQFGRTRRLGTAGRATLAGADQGGLSTRGPSAARSRRAQVPAAVAVGAQTATANYP